jgi:hypothetical protein
MSGGPELSEHRVGTPLGDVTVTARGPTRVHFEELPMAVPALPKGMRVGGVKLLRIRLEQGVTPDDAFLLTVAAARTGDASTGEWLEGMAFESPEGVLQVGLRDCEWLAGDGISASWASYEADGLQQSVTVAPPGASIFVSVAWRSVSDMNADDDVSTWLAVELALPKGRERT